MKYWKKILTRNVERDLRALVVLAVTIIGSLACASPGTSTPGRSVEMGGGYKYRIAIAHVTLAVGMQRRTPEALNLYSDASTDIGKFLEQALQKRGAEVVRAHNTPGILPDGPESPDFHRDASRLTRASLQSLDVDALLVVELKEWTPRDMRSRPRTPAAVAFRATLHGGPKGLLLWSGEFSERQVTFLDDPWQALRYPGMGTRWLTASELAHWGARQIAAEIPILSNRVLNMP